MADRIVYEVVSKPGGIDGMDSSDKGGSIRFASFDRAEAEKNADAWSTVKASVVDDVAATKAARAKLTPTDLLFLSLPLPPKKKPRTYRAARSVWPVHRASF